MAVTRTFLGFDRPALAAAVDALLGEYRRGDEVDLSGIRIALPVSRAGRRLVELLIERTEADGLTFQPPDRLVTIGELPDLLIETQRAAASDVAQRLAWIAALRSVPRHTLVELVPHSPDAEDLLGWSAVAEMMQTLHRELAGEGLSFADVAGRVEKLAMAAEGPRWAAAAAVQQAYLDQLSEQGVDDPQFARLEAAREGRCRTEHELVLIAAADMPAVLRQMLEHVADRVTAFVFAPESLADRFDELGCLRTESWRSSELEIPEDRVSVVMSPADQADLALVELESLDGEHPAEQITVGVCDEQLVPQLVQHMELAGLPQRYAAGRPLEQTPVYRLLSAAADYLDGRRFSDFAALARHADLEAAVRQQLGDRALAAGEHWLTLLDRYYSDHLQGRFAGAWLGDEATREAMAAVHETVMSLLGELTGEMRTLSDWPQPIVDFLIGVYGERRLDRRAPADRAVLETCRSIHRRLTECIELDETVDATKLTAADAIRFVLRQLAGDAVAPEPSESAIELLGWLELPLDDAPVCVVTGFNEGRVPASINEHPFLPNGLRRGLGIVDNDRRYARDAYALQAVLRSRPHVRVIAGRRTAEGDPLRPSRLLFAADPETVARRVERWLPEDPSPITRTALARLPVADGASFADPGRWPPPPPEHVEPVTHLSVTAFRDYLACPYRFYLAHVLRLQAVDDAGREMDGGAFGGLAHEVLAAFAREYDGPPEDAEAIRRYLDDRLDEVTARRYGGDPLPAVAIQREQLRQRLRAFSRWQAAHAADGWRIEQAELDVTDAPLRVDGRGVELDGRPFTISGRIDRIDVHEATGRRLILDYKTGDAGWDPDRTHRQGRKGEKQWVDLQLPLYRHLVPDDVTAGGVELGYVLLPRDENEVDLSLAPWDRDELQEADLKAREVAESVYRGEFYPPAGPVAFDDFAAICGVEQFIAMAESDAEGERDE